jgi:hypothetical protein
MSDTLASAPEGVPQQRWHSERQVLQCELHGTKVGVYSDAIVLEEMLVGKVPLPGLQFQPDH